MKEREPNRERQKILDKTSEHSDEVEVRFVRLVPNERIEQAVTFDTENAEFAGEMRITWIFEEWEKGTKITVFCENVPEGIHVEDHEAGLTSTLENLAVFAEHEERIRKIRNKRKNHKLFVCFVYFRLFRILLCLRYRKPRL
ncbi:MAG: SRPBCC domain-containing protein, partial [Blastocatellia bacterium]|nr:SRPBCC domain-containing protein [Blastocatellia bacterium]